ncbi:MAG TPA: tRNA pseudouridine(38-40) synthase TruA [Burkholderiales bacterium]|nr:tRNA pseudouridine(38-40) synthase TruA [Burkholderiales bacterium]
MDSVRVALGVEYDGAAFCGWQTQPSGCGVQDHLEAALAHIAGETVETTCAGRTDAGVHALEQVVHFDTTARRPLSAWVRGVNASLPATLAVLWSQEVRSDFHARYSARNRCYRYVLLNHPVRPAADHGRVGWFHLPLDVERMREAAQFMTGEHDFSAFRSAECQARSPVRDLRTIEIERRGVYVVFDFCANAFLHHMVRNLMGTLIHIGKGKRAPPWAAEVLASRDRSQCAPTFDAAGLYLARVEYDAEWDLPLGARSRLTLPELVQQ